MKRLLAVILAVICLTTQIAFAEPPSSNVTDLADSLYNFGLFRGTGEDADGNPIYNLKASSTRQEAIVMLVRLLGAEIEALTTTDYQPFTDVASWADKYVTYAYAKGLTNGMTTNHFGADEKISAQQFITLLLRALGYSEEKGDFTYDKALEFSDKINLTNGKYSLSGSFNRGDMVWLASSALLNETKSGTLLLLTLYKNGAINETRYEAGKYTLAEAILAEEYKWVDFNGHKVDVTTLKETFPDSANGYCRLVGFPGDDVFEILFIDQYDVTLSYKPDLNKLVTWHDGKSTQINTVGECHAMFVSGKLRSVAKGDYSKWLRSTFGDVYGDWIYSRGLAPDVAKDMVKRMENIRDGIRYELYEDSLTPDDILGLSQLESIN